MNRLVLNSFCVLALFTTVLSGFSIQRFCEKACNRGLGGNLCRCNGFHFAGKRTVLNDILPVPNSYSDEALTERGPVPAFDNDLEHPSPKYRTQTFSSTNKVKEAQLFVQWLLNHIDVVK
jgi:hypothetical protein